MSDVQAARREARRQKILQNSQSRMNRVMGRPESPELNGEEGSMTSSLSRDLNQSPPSSSPVPEVQPDPSPLQSSPYNLRRRPQRVDSASPPSAPKPTVSNSSDPDLFSGKKSEVTSSKPALLSSQTVDSSPQRLDQSQREIRPSQDAPSQAETKPGGSAGSAVSVLDSLDIKSLERLRITACVVTAFLSRWVLHLGLGMLLFQSIFIPFFAMEALFVYTQEIYLKDVMPVQSKGTVMSAALMLCGIKPDLMDVYHNIMSHVTMVASDFGLYLFSFVVLNVLMT